MTVFKCIENYNDKFKFDLMVFIIEKRYIWKNVNLDRLRILEFN